MIEYYKKREEERRVQELDGKLAKQRSEIMASITNKNR
jgi:hypothetical protein